MKNGTTTVQPNMAAKKQKMKVKYTKHFGLVYHVDLCVLLGLAMGLELGKEGFRDKGYDLGVRA